MPAPCIIEHGARDGHPQVPMARDVLLFAQQRDPWRMPHRLSRANAARGRLPAAAMRKRRLMTLRPYAAAKRTLVRRRQALRGQLGPGAADLA